MRFMREIGGGLIGDTLGFVIAELFLKGSMLFTTYLNLEETSRALFDDLHLRTTFAFLLVMCTSTILRLVHYVLRSVD
jgi:hypothetical protein